MLHFQNPSPRNGHMSRSARPNAGDTVEVLPSDRFSVDGVILTGSTAADESTLTGEPTLVPKGSGDVVRAGTLSAGDGSVVRIRVTATGSKSVLGSVIALVEDAQVQLCHQGEPQTNEQDAGSSCVEQCIVHTCAAS